MSFNKTWDDVRKDDSIELIEHPIFSTLIPKNEFYEEFSKVLNLLDGETMTDYVDFFFQKDVINKSNLKFVGENEKMDFYDWAVDEGCIAELKEIHQGESKEDKRKRLDFEKQQRLLEESRSIQKERNLKLRLRP